MAKSQRHWKYRRRDFLSVFVCAEATGKKDNQAYQQDQAKPAAADDGAAKIKPAAAEQEKQNDYDQ